MKKLEKLKLKAVNASNVVGGIMALTSEFSVSDSETITQFHSSTWSQTQGHHVCDHTYAKDK